MVLDERRRTSSGGMKIRKCKHGPYRFLGGGEGRVTKRGGRRKGSHVPIVSLSLKVVRLQLRTAVKDGFR